MYTLFYTYLSQSGEFNYVGKNFDAIEFPIEEECYGSTSDWW